MKDTEWTVVEIGCDPELWRLVKTSNHSVGNFWDDSDPENYFATEKDAQKEAEKRNSKSEVVK